MPYPVDYWEYHHKIGDKIFLYPNNEFRKIFDGFSLEKFCLLKAEFTKTQILCTIEDDEIEKYFYLFPAESGNIINDLFNNESKYYHKWKKIIRDNRDKKN